jgi:pimeloyl-ACP methyl ester carboxylesterase
VQLEPNATPATDAPVCTAYEEHGRRRDAEPVVLLHGGLLGGAATFGAQVTALAGRHQVYLPDRRGHGRTPDVPGPYTYEDMAAETIAFLTEVVRAPAHLVGFSDGGDVALLVARDRPDLVHKVVAIGANFHHDGLHPAFLAGLRGEPGAPAWASARNSSAQITQGPAPATEIIDKVEQMWLTGPTMTTADLARIQAPVLVLVGDDDCVSFDHTVTLFESLPHGQLAVVPGTSHLALEEKPSLVNALIVDFLADGRPRRTLPVRFPATG